MQMCNNKIPGNKNVVVFFLENHHQHKFNEVFFVKFV